MQSQCRSTAGEVVVGLQGERTRHSAEAEEWQGIGGAGIPTATDTITTLHTAASSTTCQLLSFTIAIRRTAPTSTPTILRTALTILPVSLLIRQLVEADDERVAGHLEQVAPILSDQMQYGSERRVELTGQLLQSVRTATSTQFGQRSEAGHVDEEEGGR